MDKNYTTVEKFKLMCAKVIPLVYEDSLSYYEFLCKVLHAVNQLIENGEILEEGFTTLNERVGTFDGRITANERNIAEYKQLLDEDIDNLSTLTGTVDAFGERITANEQNLAEYKELLDADIEKMDALTDGSNGTTIKQLIEKFDAYYNKTQADARFVTRTYVGNNYVARTDKPEIVYGVNASGIQENFAVTRNATPQSVARYKTADAKGHGKLVVGEGVIDEDAVNVGQLNKTILAKDTQYNNSFVKKQKTSPVSLYGTNSLGADIMYGVSAGGADNTIVLRTSDGRIKATDPKEINDVVTKNYLNNIAGLDKIAAAVDRVNEAAELANAAADAANEAATAAAGYEGRIVNLEGSVTAVSGRAQAAQDTANTASGKADDAIADASEAKILASTANTNANTAKSDASEAKTASTNAVAAAQNATNAANQVASRVTTIEGQIDEKIDKSDAANSAYVNDESGEPSTLKYTYTPTASSSNFLAQYDDEGVLHSRIPEGNDSSRVLTLGDTSRRLYYKNSTITLDGSFELGRKFSAQFSTGSINNTDLISIELTYRNDSNNNDTTTLNIPVVMGSGKVAFTFPFKRIDTGAIEPRVGVIDIADAGGIVIVTFYGVADNNYLQDIRLTRMTITFRAV